MTLDPWMLAGGAALAFLVVRRVAGGSRAKPDAVLERLRAGATVVDVRTPAEYRGGAYPGALNIPVTELASRLGEIPKDRPVVLYCASGLRSGSAARLLTSAGYADVVNAGGLRHMPG